MQLMVALETEDECFSASGCHHLLPERLAVGNIFQLPYVVGSGAVVPCGDRPSPALRTVRAACHRTRLALYALLERLFVREHACMKLVMAGTTKDQGFPVAGRHHTLPERLSFCHIFQFSYMMHLKGSFRRLTVLAYSCVQASDQFRPTECKVKSIRRCVDLRISWRW